MKACFFMDSGETMRSYCKRNGIVYICAVNRIEKGMTVEEAVEDARKTCGKGTGRNNCKYVLSSGETVRSACHARGLHPAVCYALVKRGYTTDEAFAELLRRKKKG